MTTVFFRCESKSSSLCCDGVLQDDLSYALYTHMPRQGILTIFLRYYLDVVELFILVQDNIAVSVWESVPGHLSVVTVGDQCAISFCKMPLVT